MNTTLNAVRVGLSRGWSEFKQSITHAGDLTYIITINAIFVVVLIFQRDSTIDGTPVSLAAATLPSLLGMTVAVGGLMGVAGVLSSDREDGTLLRAKAVPHGMVGYLVARIGLVALNTAFGIAVLLIAGFVLLDGLGSGGPSGWVALLAVSVLGLLATLPLGAIIGATVNSPQAGFGLTFLPLSGLIAISGIFYPIQAMPGWLQGVAQVFPVYWLGLGMRAAMLPDAAAAVEITGSWRQLETFVVLGAWAVVGLLIAPGVLRRMARRESGSLMEQRKQAALNRTA